MSHPLQDQAHILDSHPAPLMTCSYDAKSPDSSRETLRFASQPLRRRRRHGQRGAAGQPVLRGRAAPAGARRGVRRAAGGAAGSSQAALRQLHAHPLPGARCPSGFKGNASATAVSQSCQLTSSLFHMQELICSIGCGACPTVREGKRSGIGVCARIIYRYVSGHPARH